MSSRPAHAAKHPPVEDPSVAVRPPAEGPTTAASAVVAEARTPNQGLDRAAIISHGAKWTASWALRLIIVLVAIWAIFKVLGMFWSALLPVVMAVIFSTVLWPPARWLRSKGFKPAMAAATTMLGMIAVLAGVGTYLSTQVASQWTDLANQASKGVVQIQDWLEGPPFHVSSTQISNVSKTITEKLKTSGDQIANGVFSGVTVAGHVLVILVVSLILSFFFIKDGPNFLPMVRRVAGRGAGAHLTEAGSRTWNTLSGFIRTQAIVSAVDSIMIGAGLVILGVPLAAPLIVLTFFGGFIPIVGAFVAGVLAVLVALVTKSVTTAIIVLIIIVLVQQVEGHVLSPLLQSKSMELHPGVVLLAIAFGGEEFGIVGAFLAVPVAATVAVLFRYLNEQIDLRTGDVVAADLMPVSPEGRYAAEAGQEHGRALFEKFGRQDRGGLDGAPGGHGMGGRLHLPKLPHLGRGKHSADNTGNSDTSDISDTSDTVDVADEGEGPLQGKEM